MIEIDYELYRHIKEYLDSQTIGYKLRNLNSIVDCKIFRKILIKEISEKAAEKGKEFLEKNMEYLSGQKEYDIALAENSNDYLNSLDLSPTVKQLSERLFKVIKENTYYPVDASIIKKVEEFLKRYDNPYQYDNDEDLNTMNMLIGQLDDAIFKPRRLVDPNYDENINRYGNDACMIILYHHKYIYNVIGNDYYAEYLYDRLASLKTLLVKSKS